MDIGQVLFCNFIDFRQVQKSDQINSDCQSGSDQLGSNKKINKIGLGSTRIIKKSTHIIKKIKLHQSASLTFHMPFCLFLTNSWLHKLILFLLLLILMIH